jgi:hypothetical protein
MRRAAVRPCVLRLLDPFSIWPETNLLIRLSHDSPVKLAIPNVHFGHRGASPLARKGMILAVKVPTAAQLA